MTYTATEAYHLDHTASPVAWVSYLDNHTVQGSTPPPAKVFGDPGAGNLYYGGTKVIDNNREAFYGHRVGLFRDYFDTSSLNGLVSAVAADLAVGRVPWKSVKFPGLTWAQVASGSADTALIAHFAALDAIGKGPIMWTAHHEPNPSTTTGNTAADHLAMYRHIKTLTDPYPQILLTTCLLGGYDTVHRLGLQFGDWMQPDSCDIFGFDSYNHKSYNPATTKKDLTIQQVFGIQAAQCLALDPTKPWAVGEWGVRTDPGTPGKSAQWMQDAFDYCRNSGCYALSYFDSGTNVNDGGSPWFLDDTTDGTDGTERLNKFKSILTVNAHSKFIPAGGLVAP